VRVCVCVCVCVSVCVCVCVCVCVQYESKDWSMVYLDCVFIDFLKLLLQLQCTWLYLYILTHT